MITPDEFINIGKRKGIPQTSFFYMPVILEHAMTAPTTGIYGGNGRKDEDGPEKHRKYLKAELEKDPDKVNFDSQLDTYNPRRRHRERDADTGNIDVDRYLNGDKAPFMDVFSEQSPRPARTIILEMGSNAGTRDDPKVNETMKRRHRTVYAEALKAEAEGSPLRVIAAYSKQIIERKTQHKIFIILKDYVDPIFPGIWGAMKNAKTANSLVNLITYTMEGTRDYGNGQSYNSFRIDKEFQGEELILIDPVLIKPHDEAKIMQSR